MKTLLRARETIASAAVGIWQHDAECVKPDVLGRGQRGDVYCHSRTGERSYIVAT